MTVTANEIKASVSDLAIMAETQLISDPMTRTEDYWRGAANAYHLVLVSIEYMQKRDAAHD